MFNSRHATCIVYSPTLHLPLTVERSPGHPIGALRFQIAVLEREPGDVALFEPAQVNVAR